MKELNESIKYPTSLIVKGCSLIGIELAKSLLEQGGFVIILDYKHDYTQEILDKLKEYDKFLFIEIKDAYKLEDNIRRLDYVFHLDYNINHLNEKVSTKNFLEHCKFFDYILDLANKFSAKFLLATSIRSHQYILENKEIELNYKTSSDVHTTYSEAEFSRYAETLTHEYIQKRDLDGRIVRLGYIIGDGMDIDLDSSFEKILVDSLLKDTLKVYGDGLDSEYYVHIKDCVYGIIKALFSKNTKGQTYSLCYESEITTLSLVYIVNDSYSIPREIEFCDSNNTNNDYIKLYKPAPNLSRVGWKTRISFERAVQQSLKFIEKILSAKKNSGKRDLEEYKKEVVENQSEVDLISANTKKDEDMGPLARLIAEKKQQENGRKGSILLANNYIREREQVKRYRNYGMLYKLKNSFYRFSSKIDALKYITFNEFLYSLSIIIVGLVFYLYIISPFVYTLRNVSVGYVLATQIIKEQDGMVNDVLALQEKLVLLNKEVSDLTQTYNTYSYMSNIGVLEYEKIQREIELISNSSQMLELGLSGILEAIGQNTKLSTFDIGELNYRPSSSSLLALESTSSDTLQSYLEGVDLDLYRDSINKIKNGNKLLEGVSVFDGHKDSSRFFQNFQETLKNYENKFNGDLYFLKFLKVITRSSDANFLVTFLDNSTLTPSGGKGINFLKVRIKNFKVEEVSSKILDSKDVVNFSLGEQDKLRQIVGSDNVTLDKLFLEESLESLSLNLRQHFEDENLDGVFFMNTYFLVNLLESIGGVKVQGVFFEGENLNISIDDHLNAIDHNISREMLLAQIFSKSIQKVFGESEFYIGNFINTVRESYKTGDIYSKQFDYKFESLATKDRENQSQNFLEVYTISEGQRFSNYSVEILQNINLDGSVYTKVNMISGANRIFNDLLLCLPIQVENFVLGGNNYIEYIERGKKCFYIKGIDNREYGFEYTYKYFNDSTPIEKYDYMFNKQRGTQVFLTYSLEIMDNVEFLDYPENMIQEGTSYKFSERINQNVIFNMNINESV